MKALKLSQTGKVMQAVTVALMLAYPYSVNAMPTAALLPPETRCPANVPLTDDLLAGIFETTVGILNDFKRARSYTNELICRVSASQLQRSINKFIEPPRPDSPQEWAKFRALQQRDESGTVKEDGMIQGLAQRKQIASQIQPTAGISQTGWTALGPGNIGGRVRAAAIHPANSSIIFIGSVSGGIWKTTNGGTSWSPVNDFMGNLSVSSIVYDPTDATNNTLYAGTGEGVYDGSIDSINGFVRGAGIFKSTDGGVTWNQLASTNNSSWYYVNRLAINSAGVILAATNSGIYRSTDSGATWTQPTGGVTSQYMDIRFDPNDPTKAVAGRGVNGSGAVAYSADSGATWTTATVDAGAGRVELAYAKATAELVYASVDRNSGEIWKSTDGGATWTLYITPAHLGNQGFYDNTIWVDPTDSTHLLVGGLDIYRITGGTPSASKISTWQCSPTSPHADHHIIFSDPGYNGTSNKLVYFGNDGGVQKADDITSATSACSSNGWTDLNNGLAITQFYSGAGNATIGRTIGGTQDNGSLMTTGSTSWTAFFGGDGGYSAVDPVDGSTFYGEYVYLSIFRTSNSGISASMICDGLTDGYSSNCTGGTTAANFIAPFILDPNNSSRMLAGGQSLWLSTDVKAATPTWAKLADRSGAGSDYISAIAVAESDSTKIWYGTNNGGLYYSANGGTSFTQLNVTLSTPGRMVLRILVDKANPYIVYVSYGGFSADNLYKLTSVDAGANWAKTNITGTLPSVPIRGLARHPANANWLYAGTEVGIFNTTDGGNNWFTTNDGPANVSVDELFWYDNATLVAATHGRGMFKTTVDTTNPGDTLSVTSTKANGRYKSGEVIDIQVTFAKAVNVTGTPQLALSSGGVANYLSGSGTTALTFRYTVGASDNAADLDYAATSSLTLNGGTIVDKITADASTLTLPTPGAEGSLGYSKAVVVDSALPVISSVIIPAATMKIGSMVTATITVSSDTDTGYTLAGSTVGGFTLGNLSRVSDTSYTATFTVTDGGADVAAGSNIPVSVTLTDGAGNDSTAYTTAIVQAGDAIDANKPVISAVTIPNVPMKVGDLVTATITVASDTDTYTLKTGATIGGFALGLAKTNNTTYTATFTVAEGGADVSAGSNIPVSLTLVDTALNESAAYTTAITQAADAIDANAPATPTLSILAVNGLGGNITIAAPPPVGTTAWLAPAGTTVFTFTDGATMTKLDGTGSATSIATPTTAGAYKLYWVDAAGNISVASTNAITVDATPPSSTITSAEFDPAANTLTLTGTNMNTLLEAGEDGTTDIKARLDWTKLAWDINGDGGTTADKTFVVGDITSVLATSATKLQITLTSAAASALKSMAGYGAVGGADNIVATTGLLRDQAGNPATTDAANSVVTILPVVTAQPSEWLTADAFGKADAATPMVKFTLQGDGGQTLNTVTVTVADITGGLQAGDIESLTLETVGNDNVLTPVGTVQTTVAIDGSATTITAGTQAISTATTFAVRAKIKATAPTNGAAFRLDMAANGIALSANSPVATVLTSLYRLNIDTVAPTAGSVAVSGMTSASATLAATLSEAGTGYWVVLPATENAPSVTQVKAGQDSVGTTATFKGNSAMTANNAVQFSISGLAASTSYKAYFAAVDLAGNDITVATEVAFATSAAAVVSSGGGTYTPPAQTTTTVTPGSTATIGNTTTPVDAGAGSTLNVTAGTSGATINLPTPLATGATATDAVNVKIGDNTLSVKPTESGSVVKTATVSIDGKDTTVLNVTAGTAQVTASAAGQPLVSVGTGANAVVISSGSANATVITSVDKTTGVTSLTLPKPTTSNDADASVNMTIGGQAVNVQPSGGGDVVVILKTVTVNGVSTQVVSVTGGSATVTASQPNQPLLAVGGGSGSNAIVVTADTAGTAATSTVNVGTGETFIAVSSGVVTLPTNAFAAAGNGFAAIKDGKIYAGEIAVLNSAGKITSVRLGSQSGAAANVGDPVNAKMAGAAGLTVNVAVPNLKGKVARVSDTQDFGDVMVAALGAGFTSKGQNSSGVLSLTFPGGGSANALPLGEITVDTSRADGISIIGNGKVEVAKNGVIARFAPAVADPAQLAVQVVALDKKGNVTVNDYGVLQASVNGVTYALQPGWVVSQASGALAGFTLDADGRVVYQDGAGNVQMLYPAFADLTQLVAAFQSLDANTGATGHDDGTVTAKLLGVTYTLTPDYALIPVQAEHAKDAWWVDGGKVFVKTGDGKSAQGFNVK